MDPAAAVNRSPHSGALIDRVDAPNESWAWQLLSARSTDRGTVSLDGVTTRPKRRHNWLRRAGCTTVTLHTPSGCHVIQPAKAPGRAHHLEARPGSEPECAPQTDRPYLLVRSQRPKGPKPAYSRRAPFKTSAANSALLARPKFLAGRIGLFNRPPASSIGRA